MTFQQWQGQQPGQMVVATGAQPGNTSQIRQLGTWDSSCCTAWQECTHTQQDEQDMSGEQQCSSLKASGCKRGGRPVTWIGGGGMDPKKLAGLGVPVLRTLFQQVFGQETASNNAAWLRRKLAESPDSIHGQRRSPVVRARDVGAAIWNQDADHPSDDHQGQPAEWQQQGNDPMGVQQQQQLGNGFGGGAGGACGQQMEGGAQGSLGHSMGHQESGPTPPGSPVSGMVLLGSRSASVQQPSSPAGTSLGKKRTRPVAASSRSSLSSAPQHGCYATGDPIRPDTVTDSNTGRKVLVYWPADQQWWEATLCWVDTSLKQLQLLYADMTEEVVSGRDYDDLLANGHLLDVEQRHHQPGATTATPAASAAAAMVSSTLSRMIPVDPAQQASPAARQLAASPSSLSTLQQQPLLLPAGQPVSPQALRLAARDSLAGGFRPAFRPTATLQHNQEGADMAGASTAGAAGGSASCMVPLGATACGTDAAARVGMDDACVVPIMTAGEDECRDHQLAMGMVSAEGVRRDSSRLSAEAVAAALTHNSSRRSTRDRCSFRVSGSGSGSGACCGGVPGGSGSGSGNNSASCGPDSDGAALPAKRQCFELSGNTSDLAADTANMAAEGSSMLAPAPLAAPQQQQTGQQQQQQLLQQQSMAPQLQQKVGDPSQLGLWFANQQLQQLHLQEQVQQNMELQQQAHLQMQQQMAAHMQMRMAGQLMQQQMAAAAAAPFCFAGAAMAAAAAAGMFAMPAGTSCMDAPVSSPLAASAAAYSMPSAADSQQLLQPQQQQQQAAACAQLAEPTSPLACAAAAAAAAAGVASAAACGWPNAAAAGQVESSQLAALAAAGNGERPRAPVPCLLQPQQQVCYSQAGMLQPAQAMYAFQQQQLGGGGSVGQASVAPAGSAVVMPASVFGQLPLPQAHPVPQAPLQPALPDTAAAAGAWQVAAPTATAVAPAAAAKPVKAVIIKPEPEYATYTQHWGDAAAEPATTTARAEAAGRSHSPCWSQELLGGEDSRECVAPAAAAAISGMTAGCVSGFTGGAASLEALDEVDTLLSRPGGEGLFSVEGACEGEGGQGPACSGGQGCWELLGMPAMGDGQARDEGDCEFDGEGGVCEGFGRDSGCEGFGQDSGGVSEGLCGCEFKGCEGGCDVASGCLERAMGRRQGSGEVCGGVGVGLDLAGLAELAAAAVGRVAQSGGWSGAGAGVGGCGGQEGVGAHRPNSALAHVFDYA